MGVFMRITTRSGVLFHLYGSALCSAGKPEDDLTLTKLLLVESSLFDQYFGQRLKSRLATTPEH